jgi:predicted secreted hydrolase
MANSIRARLVGVALGALAAACGSCTAPISNDAKLHLAAALEDFKALGIGKEIEVREDGRRTPQSSDYFEWWYFDGLFDDGSVFVVWFGDNWLYGSHKRALNIDLTPPGKPTWHIVRTFDDPGAFSSDHADVQIGPHSFKGDLDTYTIHVDAAETGGVGCDLTLRRRVPSYRPGTGYIEAGDRFFAWLVAVPEGSVTGTLTADGVTRQVTGSGYHDHNWGNV